MVSKKHKKKYAVCKHCGKEFKKRKIGSVRILKRVSKGNMKVTWFCSEACLLSYIKSYIKN